jgi:hypothetical protein
VFTNYEQTLRSFIKKQYRVDTPDTRKLEQAVEELKKILLKFDHRGTILEALKRSLQLDHQSLLKFFEEMRFK